MTGTLQPAGSCHVGGRFVEGTAGEKHAVIDPSDGSLLADLELAGDRGRRRAVGAARAAFPELVRRDARGAQRGASSGSAAALGRARATSSPRPRSRQAGKPIRLSAGFDVPGTVDNTAFFAGAARNLEGKAAGEYSGDHTSMIRREPIGVVGSIAPWNYPLQMAAWKILPAIAAGNTIVLKPAELTPLTSLMFAEAATDAGHPGRRASTSSPARARSPARRWSAHPDVDMVSFTGSTAVGKRVMETRRRRPPSACTWSSAARRRSSCSTTPTSRPRSTARSPGR